eukprot:gene13302-9139_t
MGSLFQLRDYWSTSITSELSPSAFVVGNVDNEGNCDKIAVGTFEGHLQILRPPSRDEPDVADVLYEQHFGEPILQLSLGDFEVITEGITQKLLAILFPRRILLARIQKYGEEVQFPKFEGSDELETLTFSVYSLEIYFEANLTHSAYNMTVGRLGRATHDLACVQAIDGHLTIVDHNKVLFSGSIPSEQFLLPGCLAYSGDRDVLLTNNSSMFLMCYSFPSIVNAFQAESGGAAAQWNSSHAQLKPTWTFNLGEDAVAIEICRCFRSSATKENSIVVLCPYSLYVLTSSGVCYCSRRLDVECISLKTYRVHTIDVDNLLVGSATGTISVYSDTDLLWCTAMPSGTPLSVSVGHLCGAEGMIATLGEDKTITVGYLGTDPSEAPVQLLESRVQHYSDMVAELGTLNGLVKQLEVGGREKVPQPAAPPPSGSDALAADNSFLRLSVQLSDVICESNNNAVDAILTLSVSPVCPRSTISDITVRLEATEPIVPSSYVLTVEELERDHSEELKVRLMPKEDLDMIIPSSLHFMVVATGSVNEQQIFTREGCFVPFALVAAPAPTVKAMAFSVQLNSDKHSPVSLLDIFGDLSVFGKLSSNVLCINYINGTKAMVLVSKNAGRYKIQSTNMEGLCLLFSQLIQRLRYFYGQRGETVTFEIPDPCPVKEFMSCLSLHGSVRRELEAAEEELESAAVFFRLVEKRMLCRFRDKNPSSTEALEILFTEACFMMQSATDATIAGKSRLRQASAIVNACSRFIFSFFSIKYANSIASADADFLERIFQRRITDDKEECWEEHVYGALRHVLTRPGAVGTPPVSLSATYSLGRLEDALTHLDTHLAAKQPLLPPHSASASETAFGSYSSYPSPDTLGHILLHYVVANYLCAILIRFFLVPRTRVFRRVHWSDVQQRLTDCCVLIYQSPAFLEAAYILVATIFFLIPIAIHLHITCNRFEFLIEKDFYFRLAPCCGHLVAYFYLIKGTGIGLTAMCRSIGCVHRLCEKYAAARWITALLDWVGAAIVLRWLYFYMLAVIPPFAAWYFCYSFKGVFFLMHTTIHLGILFLMTTLWLYRCCWVHHSSRHWRRRMVSYALCAVPIVLALYTASVITGTSTLPHLRVSILGEPVDPCEAIGAQLTPTLQFSWVFPAIAPGRMMNIFTGSETCTPRRWHSLGFVDLASETLVVSATCRDGSTQPRIFLERPVRNTKSNSRHSFYDPMPHDNALEELYGTPEKAAEKGVVVHRGGNGAIQLVEWDPALLARKRRESRSPAEAAVRRYWSSKEVLEVPLGRSPSYAVDCGKGEDEIFLYPRGRRERWGWNYEFADTDASDGKEDVSKYISLPPGDDGEEDPFPNPGESVYSSSVAPSVEEDASSTVAPGLTNGSHSSGDEGEVHPTDTELGEEVTSSTGTELGEEVVYRTSEVKGNSTSSTEDEESEKPPTTETDKSASFSSQEGYETLTKEGYVSYDEDDHHKGSRDDGRHTKSRKNQGHTSRNDGAPPANIVVLFFDSMSRQDAVRELPKFARWTRTFVKENRTGHVVFEPPQTTYGSKTIDNYPAMLTGLTAAAINETITPADYYLFDLAKKKYQERLSTSMIASYNEDYATMGAVRDGKCEEPRRCYGIDETVFTPFTELFYPHCAVLTKRCVYKRYSHEHQLDYTRHVINHWQRQNALLKDKNVSYFHWSVFMEPHEPSHHVVSLADGDLVAFMESLEKELKFFDDPRNVLIIIGDHGNHMQPYYGPGTTGAGLFENTTPVALYFIHPELMRRIDVLKGRGEGTSLSNLLSRRKKIGTHIDMYLTLGDLLDIPVSVHGKYKEAQVPAASYFEERSKVPKSCFDLYSWGKMYPTCSMLHCVAVPDPLFESYSPYGRLGTLKGLVKPLGVGGREKVPQPAAPPPSGSDALAADNSFLRLSVQLSDVICESNNNAVDAILTLSVSPVCPRNTISDITVRLEATEPIVPSSYVLTVEELERDHSEELTGTKAMVLVSNNAGLYTIQSTNMEGIRSSSFSPSLFSAFVTCTASAMFQRRITDDKEECWEEHVYGALRHVLPRPGAVGTPPVSLSATYSLGRLEDALTHLDTHLAAKQPLLPLHSAGASETALVPRTRVFRRVHWSDVQQRLTDCCVLMHKYPAFLEAAYILVATIFFLIPIAIHLHITCNRFEFLIEKDFYFRLAPCCGHLVAYFYLIKGTGIGLTAMCRSIGCVHRLCEKYAAARWITALLDWVGAAIVLRWLYFYMLAVIPPFYQRYYCYSFKGVFFLMHTTIHLGILFLMTTLWLYRCCWVHHSSRHWRRRMVSYALCAVPIVLALYTAGVITGTSTLPHLRVSILGEPVDPCEAIGAQLTPTLQFSWVFPAIVPARMMNIFTGSEACAPRRWHSLGFVDLASETLVVSATCRDGSTQPRIFLERPVRNKKSNSRHSFYDPMPHDNALEELYGTAEKAAEKGVVVHRGGNGAIQLVEWDPALLARKRRESRSPAEAAVRRYWSSKEVLEVPLGRSPSYAVDCGKGEDEIFLYPRGRRERWGWNYEFADTDASDGKEDASKNISLPPEDSTSSTEDEESEKPPTTETDKPASFSSQEGYETLTKEGYVSYDEDDHHKGSRDDGRHTKSRKNQGHTSRNDGAPPANIVVLFFDSMSRQDAVRELPKFTQWTRTFVKENRTGHVVFEPPQTTYGYKTIDNYPAMLTGLTAAVINETITPADYYLFDLAKKKYQERLSTSMISSDNDDYATLGALRDETCEEPRRCYGIDETVFTPFTELFYPHCAVLTKRCVYNRYSHEHQLDYTRHVINHWQRQNALLKDKNVSYFHWSVFMEPHEPSHHVMSLADGDLVAFMESLEKELKFFDDPRNVLIIIGDHGNHMQPYWGPDTTGAGLFENTTPVALYFIHPELMRRIDVLKGRGEGTSLSNLLSRRKKIGTHIDMYLTLGDLLDIPVSVHGKYKEAQVPAASYFEERSKVPKSCFDLYSSGKIVQACSTLYCVEVQNATLESYSPYGRLGTLKGLVKPLEVGGREKVPQPAAPPPSGSDALAADNSFLRLSVQLSDVICESNNNAVDAILILSVSPVCMPVPRTRVFRRVHWSDVQQRLTDCCVLIYQSPAFLEAAYILVATIFFLIPIAIHLHITCNRFEFLIEKDFYFRLAPCCGHLVAYFYLIKGTGIGLTAMCRSIGCVHRLCEKYAAARWITALLDWVGAAIVLRWLYFYMLAVIPPFYGGYYCYSFKGVFFLMHTTIHLGILFLMTTLWLYRCCWVHHSSRHWRRRMVSYALCAVPIVLALYTASVITGTSTLPHLRVSILGEPVDPCEAIGAQLTPTLQFSWVFPAIVPARMMNIFTGSEACAPRRWHSLGFVDLASETLHAARIFLERPVRNTKSNSRHSFYDPMPHDNALEELYGTAEKAAEKGVVVHRGGNGAIQLVEWDPALLARKPRESRSPAEAAVRRYWSSKEVLEVPLGRSPSYAVDCGKGEDEIFLYPRGRRERWGWNYEFADTDASDGKEDVSKYISLLPGDDGEEDPFPNPGESVYSSSVAPSVEEDASSTVAPGLTIGSHSSGDEGEVHPTDTELGEEVTSSTGTELGEEVVYRTSEVEGNSTSSTEDEESEKPPTTETDKSASFSSQEGYETLTKEGYVSYDEDDHHKGSRDDGRHTKSRKNQGHTSRNDGAPPANIVVLYFDAMSRQDAVRELPKFTQWTRTFVKENRTGHVVFEPPQTTYGTNTIHNYPAMLTGLTAAAINETITPADYYLFDLAKKKYQERLSTSMITSYNEDYATMGALRDETCEEPRRCYGIDETVFTPFTELFYPHCAVLTKRCVYKRYSHEHQLDYTRHVINHWQRQNALLKDKNVSYFHWSVFMEPHEPSHHVVSLADGDLVAFMESLEKELKFFDDPRNVLIIIGDHGNHMQPYYGPGTTGAGLFENTTPVALYFIHPELMRRIDVLKGRGEGTSLSNLLSRRKKIGTHIDMYLTLGDLLDIPVSVHGKYKEAQVPAASYFEERSKVPKSCFDLYSWGKMYPTCSMLHCVAVPDPLFESPVRETAGSRRSRRCRSLPRRPSGSDALAADNSFLRLSVQLSDVICESNNNAVDAILTLSVSPVCPRNTISDITVRLEATEPIVPSSYVLTVEELERDHSEELTGTKAMVLVSNNAGLYTIQSTNMEGIRSSSFSPSLFSAFVTCTASAMFQRRITDDKEECWEEHVYGALRHVLPRPGAVGTPPVSLSATYSLGRLEDALTHLDTHLAAKQPLLPPHSAGVSETAFGSYSSYPCHILLHYLVTNSLHALFRRVPRTRVFRRVHWSDVQQRLTDCCVLIYQSPAFLEAAYILVATIFFLIPIAIHLHITCNRFEFLIEKDFYFRLAPCCGHLVAYFYLIKGTGIGLMAMCRSIGCVHRLCEKYAAARWITALLDWVGAAIVLRWLYFYMLAVIPPFAAWYFCYSFKGVFFLMHTTIHLGILFLMTTLWLYRCCWVHHSSRHWRRRMVSYALCAVPIVLALYTAGVITGTSTLPHLRVSILGEPVDPCEAIGAQLTPTLQFSWVFPAIVPGRMMNIFTGSEACAPRRWHSLGFVDLASETLVVSATAQCGTRRAIRVILFYDPMPHDNALEELYGTPEKAAEKGVVVHRGGNGAIQLVEWDPALLARKRRESRSPAEAAVRRYWSSKEVLEVPLGRSPSYADAENGGGWNYEFADTDASDGKEDVSKYISLPPGDSTSSTEDEEITMQWAEELFRRVPRTRVFRRVHWSDVQQRLTDCCVLIYQSPAFLEAAYILVATIFFLIPIAIQLYLTCEKHFVIMYQKDFYFRLIASCGHLVAYFYLIKGTGIGLTAMCRSIGCVHRLCEKYAAARWITALLDWVGAAIVLRWLYFYMLAVIPPFAAWYFCYSFKGGFFLMHTTIHLGILFLMTTLWLYRCCWVHHSSRHWRRRMVSYALCAVPIVLALYTASVITGTSTLPHLRVSILGEPVDPCEAIGAQLTPTLQFSWVFPAIVPARMMNIFTGSEACAPRRWHSLGFVDLASETLVVSATCRDGSTQPRIFLERPVRNTKSNSRHSFYVPMPHDNALEELYGTPEKAAEKGVVVHRGGNGAIQLVEWDPALLARKPRESRSPAETAVRRYWSSKEVLEVPLGRSPSYAVDCGKGEDEIFLYPRGRRERWGWNYEFADIEASDGKEDASKYISLPPEDDGEEDPFPNPGESVYSSSVAPSVEEDASSTVAPGLTNGSHSSGDEGEVHPTDTELGEEVTSSTGTELGEEVVYRTSEVEGNSTSSTEDEESEKPPTTETDKPASFSSQEGYETLTKEGYVSYDEDDHHKGSRDDGRHTKSRKNQGHTSRNDGAPPANIVVLFFDSMSRQDAVRELPKLTRWTRTFVKENRTGHVVFEPPQTTYGYKTIDNYPAMLTGLTAAVINETITPADYYLFDLAKKKYQERLSTSMITSYNEDYATMGALRDETCEEPRRCYGIDETVFTPFTELFYPHCAVLTKRCVYNRYSHEHQLDYTRHVINHWQRQNALLKDKNVSYFHWSVFMEPHEPSHHVMSLADGDLVAFMESLEKELKFFDDPRNVLIIIGDHGNHMQPYCGPGTTGAGLFENTTPVALYFIHPELMRRIDVLKGRGEGTSLSNLLSRRKKIGTHIDMYLTLGDLLDIPVSVHGKYKEAQVPAASYFEERSKVPKSCFDLYSWGKMYPACSTLYCVAVPDPLFEIVRHNEMNRVSLFVEYLTNNLEGNKSIFYGVGHCELQYQKNIFGLSQVFLGLIAFILPFVFVSWSEDYRVHECMRRQGSSIPQQGKNTASGSGTPKTLEGPRNIAAGAVDLYHALRVAQRRETGMKGSERSSFSPTFTVLPYPRGLFNSKNFCFINAVLQALIFTPPLAQMAVSAEKSGSTECPTLAALGKFFLSYWKPGLTRASLLPPQLPLKRDNIFSGGSQCDAQEYLQCLLECVDAELMAVEVQLAAEHNTVWGDAGSTRAKDLKGWTTVNGKEKTTYRVDRSKHSVLFTSVFGGVLENRVCGNSKGRVSATVEPFFMLTLKIGFKSACTIEEALQYTFKMEQIEGGTKPITTRTVFVELPDILILHLSRWAVTREGSIVKLDNTVSFKNSLTFPSSICADRLVSLPQRTYRLLSAVAHRGSFEDSGHYVTYIAAHAANPANVGPRAGHSDPNSCATSTSRRAAVPSGTYVLCDDSKISLVGGDALQRETVYFLIYQRC